jgi:xylulokinase
VSGVFAGIDVGTSALKAVAIDASGRVVARSEAAYPLSSPRPGWSEQQPEAWVSAARSALDSLGAGGGAGPLAGIGLSGQMHGLVALDGSLRPLRPAILWNDQRTAAECVEIEETLGRSRLISLTGNVALTGFTAPKLVWMRRHESELFERIRHVLLPKDYVRLALTGELATDVADASGTLLFDVARRRWSEEVAGALGIPVAWLPPALESPVSSGRFEGAPVAAGAGDQAAGAVGVGVAAPGPASVVLGTSGVVLAAMPSFSADPEGRVHSFCHAVPDVWHAMGVMLSAAGSLRWFADALGGGATIEQLLEEAAAVPAGAEGVTFLPYLTGERTPHADPDARGAFVGLHATHSRGALVRAVLEGVAFGLRDSLDLLHETGLSVDVARVSGGGARSSLWLEIVASTLEVPLERVAVDEGAAYGAALLGGVAAGAWSGVDEAVAACVRPLARVEPNPGWVGVYRERRELFRALYPALRSLAAGEP